MLNWSTFGSNYSLEPVWVCCNKLCSPGLGIFCHSSLQILSNSIRLDSHFQISPEMFVRVQVQALTGPLQDIPSFVPKPLLCCPGCVLWDIVMLEGEPSAQSEVLVAVEQIFIKDLCTSHPSAFLQPWPVSQSLLLKHPHSTILTPPCVTVGMVLGRVLSDQIILFLTV